VTAEPLAASSLSLRFCKLASVARRKFRPHREITSKIISPALHGSIHKEAPLMDSDLRRSPRYPFYASAEITELQTKTSFSARTSELSRHGCYMDMMNPFPLATSVKIQITYNDQKFEALGRVIYAQPNMGMGVSFEAAQPKDEETLEKWLVELKGNQD
jgi:hypothetical protein